jgi:type IV pilus assembly protein PilY1
VLDKNRDGFADRVYVGDTCGQVWRADIGSSSMDEWTVTKIAALSSTTATDIANKRKLLFAPDLVFGTDATGNYTAVLLGSGDREHPFDSVVVNRFYMLKDRDSSDTLVGAPNSSSVKISGFGTTPTGSPYADSDLFDATNTALVSGTDPLGLNGWKITLGAGEKVVSTSTSVGGSTFFNTNQPTGLAQTGTCGSDLGIAREYIVGFADAAATVDLNASGTVTIADRSTIHPGGGYLPSPVPVVVEIDGKKYQAVISGTAVQTPPGVTLEKRTRTFWYKELD